MSQTDEAAGKSAAGAIDSESRMHGTCFWQWPQHWQQYLTLAAKRHDAGQHEYEGCAGQPNCTYNSGQTTFRSGSAWRWIRWYGDEQLLFNWSISGHFGR